MPTIGIIGKETQRVKKFYGQHLCQAMKEVGLDATMNNFEADILFRWGNQRKPHADEGRKVINKYTALKVTKLEQLRKLKEGRVSVPPMVETAEEMVFEGGSVWLHRQESHFQGRDIKVIRRPARISGGFFTKFIPAQREWRVVVLNNRIVRVMEKTNAKPEKNKMIEVGGERYHLMRNEGAGWAYTARLASRQEYDPRLTALARKAVKVLGLEFGAVDIIEDMEGKWYVLEVNTAPGLGQPRMLRIAKMLKEDIEEGRV